MSNKIPVVTFHLPHDSIFSIGSSTKDEIVVTNEQPTIITSESELKPESDSSQLLSSAASVDASISPLRPVNEENIEFVKPPLDISESNFIAKELPNEIEIQRKPFELEEAKSKHTSVDEDDYDAEIEEKPIDKSPGN